MNAVTPSLRPDVKHRVPDPLRLPEKDLVFTHDPECERVYQRVETVRLVEYDFPADRRHPERVPVMPDPLDAALQYRPVSCSVLLIIERPEAKRVHRRDRPSAHREHVPKDPTDARRRPLERLDERRMIVRFHLEGHAPVIPDIHHAGVLARRHDHALARRRQPLQMHPRRFVRAVLRPHHREDAELRHVRLPPHDLLDLLVLLGRQIVLRYDLRRDGCFVHPLLTS